MTASYGPDLDRCRLLCDSMDALVEDRPDHFILVDNDDYNLFSQLAGKRRHIINEFDILPSWLHSIHQGFSSQARKLWFSTRTWPMRGWHVQQLRRIALAAHVNHDALLFCDSDMLFVRPFHTGQVWQGDKIRLYRMPDGINDGLYGDGKQHMDWTRSAAKLNGLPMPGFPAPDYINTLISWDRRVVLDMCEHIAHVTKKHWVAALGSNRSFSECQIYGAYADGVRGGEGHWHAEHSLCQTYWLGDALSFDDASRFLETMDDDQVAIGVQSFTGTEPDVLRRLLTA